MPSRNWSCGRRAEQLARARRHGRRWLRHGTGGRPGRDIRACTPRTAQTAPSSSWRDRRGFRRRCSAAGRNACNWRTDSGSGVGTGRGFPERRPGRSRRPVRSACARHRRETVGDAKLPAAARRSKAQLSMLVDPRQRRRFALHACNESVDRARTAADAHENTIAVVQHLAAEVELPGHPPDGRAKPDTLHAAAHANFHRDVPGPSRFTRPVHAAGSIIAATRASIQA